MRFAELQRQFVAALYGDPADLCDAIREDGGIGAAERIAIYRNNLHAGFEKALALEFPVIAALCGAEYFTALARAFQLAHPSRSGDLHYIGDPFPGYLQQRFRGGEFVYFADVAALEWAREESTRAADAAPLDLESLRAVVAEETPDLRFAIHPAVQLVASRWPVLTIWEAHQGSGEVRSVDPGAGPEQVLVRRTASRLVLERISAADLALLATLQRGGTLGEAFDAALSSDPAYDITAALQRFVACGVFSAPLD